MALVGTINLPVEGFCPMGCGRTLIYRGNQLNGKLTCYESNCPDPGSAQKILSDSETEHVVTFTEDGFNLKHPLRERIGDQLLNCDIHGMLSDLPGPPDTPLPATYRVRNTTPEDWEGVRFSFEGVETPTAALGATQAEDQTLVWVNPQADGAEGLKST